jgi:hypothetical protein
LASILDFRIAGIHVQKHSVISYGLIHHKLQFDMVVSFAIGGMTLRCGAGRIGTGGGSMRQALSHAASHA